VWIAPESKQGLIARDAITGPGQWPGLLRCGLYMRPRLWTINRPRVKKDDIDMWVAKPIYESLPYFYLFVGMVSLGLSMYLNYWYMPTICFVVGLGCLVAGLVVLLKRRDHRVTDRRNGQRQDY
jgi:hypothetical protein